MPAAPMLRFAVAADAADDFAAADAASHAAILPHAAER